MLLQTRMCFMLPCQNSIVTSPWDSRATLGFSFLSENLKWSTFTFLCPPVLQEATKGTIGLEQEGQIIRIWEEWFFCSPPHATCIPKQFVFQSLRYVYVCSMLKTYAPGTGVLFDGAWKP